MKTALTRTDRVKGWGARWGIGRFRYRVSPGLYAVGNPGPRSEVLVTANYKLTFDALRRELPGLDAWILVLDTRGINVWCAAGKGTFGTEELIRSIRAVGLNEIVSQRTIILPQLGAPGVAAHEVRRQTGFTPAYGPVRARDIRQFLKARKTATAEMRTVTFGLWERLAVAPVELIRGLKYLLLLIAALALVSLCSGSFSLPSLTLTSLPFIGAFLIGMLGVPALLPWIPFRAFALKGWALGIPWGVAASIIQHAGPARSAGNLLLLPAMTAFLALNFTGSTTFTSQTGVNKEIRLFARPIAVTGILGILLLIGGSV